MSYTFYLSNTKAVNAMICWCFKDDSGAVRNRAYTLKPLALNHKVVVSNTNEKEAFLASIKDLVAKDRIVCTEDGAKPDDSVMNKVAESLADEETKEKQEGFEKLEEAQSEALKAQGLDIELEKPKATKKSK